MTLDRMDGFGLRDAARRGIPANAVAGFRSALSRRLDVLKTAGPEGNAEVAAIRDALELAPFYGEPYFLVAK